MKITSLIKRQHCIFVNPLFHTIQQEHRAVHQLGRFEGLRHLRSPNWRSLLRDWCVLLSDFLSQACHDQCHQMPDDSVFVRVQYAQLCCIPYSNYPKMSAASRSGNAPAAIGLPCLLLRFEVCPGSGKFVRRLNRQ